MRKIGTITEMNSGRLSAFNMSVRGSSHIEYEKECQDRSYSWTDGRRAVIAVCDGHGGRDYIRSAEGAEFGCRAAAENIKEFIKNAGIESLRRDSSGMLRALEASIIHSWNEYILKHYREKPFLREELEAVSERAREKYTKGQSIEEAYGTTLIAAAVTDDYWFCVQIGDGKCAAAESSPLGTDAPHICAYPVPWDDACIAGYTTSMCEEEALVKFREFFSEDVPGALFICTDGLSDCFSSEDQLGAFYGSVLFSFGSKDGAAAEEELLEFLPRLSAKGSRDDISIAGMIQRKMSGGISSKAESRKRRRKAHKKKKKKKKGIKR